MVPISLVHTPHTQASPCYVYSRCSANACSLNVWEVDYLTETGSALIAMSSSTSFSKAKFSYVGLKNDPGFVSHLHFTLCHKEKSSQKSHHWTWHLAVTLLLEDDLVATVLEPPSATS